MQWYLRSFLPSPSAFLSLLFPLYLMFHTLDFLGNHRLSAVLNGAVCKWKQTSPHGFDDTRLALCFVARVSPWAHSTDGGAAALTTVWKAMKSLLSAWSLSVSFSAVCVFVSKQLWKDLIDLPVVKSLNSVFIFETKMVFLKVIQFFFSNGDNVAALSDALVDFCN